MTTSDLMILRLAIDGIEARVRKAYEETGAAKSIGSRQTLSETLDNINNALQIVAPRSPSAHGKTLSETLDNARDNINNALQIVEALKATLKL